MTKPLHCGNAARNGVMAAMLAGKGFTSHPAAFEGSNGYFGTFGRALPTNFEPFADLGSRWDIETIGYSIKNYPSGGRGHTAIEAALILRDKIGARVSDIANIHCWVSPSSAKRINTDYPRDVEAAKFSAAYVLAYSLVHGAPKIKAFTEAALKDPHVRAMAKLVTAAADPNLSDAVRGESGAAQDHAEGRPSVRASARLRDRIGKGADDAGTDRGEVHGLRDADRQCGGRAQALAHREQLRRAADLRRFLDTDPKGVNAKQALVFPERGRLL